ncbi:GGDEF domain-containing protein [Alicyclobacillus fructus]|uniref:GGDEF domain-containing protein n=1 Tax=Alicyclobacillus fructus TaxID=2816082 RepID=UPI001A8FC23C|nr:GGDEF domain-containing protein [Alicyclobacillus fructus]
MDAGALSALFRHTRTWGRAQRGLELFQYASDALTTLAAVDGGLFIYRKRGVETGGDPLPPAIYHRFGVLAEGLVPACMDEIMQSSITLDMPVGRWMLTEDIEHPDIRAWLLSLSVLEFGVWPLYSREEVRGAVVVVRTQPVVHLTWETSHALLEACAAQISLALDMIMAIRIAEHASHRDLLTGVWNRLGIERRWPHILRSLTENAARHVIVGIVDIDHFKDINDTYGHPVGDRVLRLVAQTLQEESKPDELVGRIGGDEFVVIAWAESPDWRSRMQAMQQAVHERSQGTCAVSVGGSVFGLDGDNFDSCYAVADARLYENKRWRKRRGANPVS